jgi:hypothetical protein
MLDIRNLELGISQQADPPTGVTRKWELIEERNEKRWQLEEREPRNEPDHRRCSIFVEKNITQKYPVPY